LHDIRNLDGRGIPGGFVASSVFQTAAQTQADSLGFPANRVFVRHPIQDRTDDELRALADDTFNDIYALICEGPSN
jgi:hypothetical protein